MARINITRLPLPQDDVFDRQQQDILIRELENIINQLNFYVSTRLTRRINNKDLVLA